MLCLVVQGNTRRILLGNTNIHSRGRNDSTSVSAEVLVSLDGIIAFGRTSFATVIVVYSFKVLVPVGSWYKSKEISLSLYVSAHTKGHFKPSFVARRGCALSSQLRGRLW